jgi:RNA polymerase sigma-70 factor (ECF subfamily)
LYERGRAAWPAIAVDFEPFAQQFAGVVSDGDDGQLAADLYLVCACARGADGALAAFDRVFMRRVGDYLARLSPTPAFVEDVRQSMYEKLFVGSPEAPPKIAQFAGRGPLDGWLRVIALRVAVNLRQRRGERVPAEEPSPAQIGDPELDIIKGRYGPQFKQAFERALSTLSSEQRSLLRMHFVDGLTLDQLAVVFRVHRVTLSRRLAAMRRIILGETRRLIADELALSPSECNSLMGLLRSQLEVSITQLLAPAAD